MIHINLRYGHELNNQLAITTIKETLSYFFSFYTPSFHIQIKTSK